MIIFWVGLSAQERIYVSKEAIGLNDGTSWGNAHNNLQAALNRSKPGDILWIHGGTYYPTINDDRNATFKIKSGQKWFGGFDGNEAHEDQRRISRSPTILSGNIGDRSLATDNVYTVLTAIDTDTTTYIDGLDILEGYADGSLGDLPQDAQGCGGGIHLKINDIAVGGLKISQTDFIRNFSNNHGGAITMTGDNDSKVVLNMEICFFNGNKTNGKANLIYIDHLSEKKEHWLMDTQIRGGGVRSKAEEFYFHLSGSFQNLNIVSTIAGKFEKVGKNRFITIENSAEKSNIRFIDNQIFESHFDTGINITNRSGNVDFVFDENFILDIYSDNDFYGTFINAENLGNGIISFSAHNNTIRRANLSSFISGSAMNSLSSGSNLFLRNKFTRGAFLSQPAAFMNQQILTYNSVFSFNEGPIFAVEYQKENQVKWNLLNCTFYENTLNSESFFSRLTGVQSLFYFHSEDEKRFTIQNNIYSNENVSSSVFYTDNSNIDLSHNLFVGQDCDEVVKINENGSMHCKNNIYGTSAIFIKDDGRDMSLAYCSRGIDEGTNEVLTLISEDFNGTNPRKKGKSTDIGAVEQERIIENFDRLCSILDNPVEVPDFGQKPYSFAWTDTHGNTGNIINGLIAGKYQLTITDALLCTVELEHVVSDPGNFNFENADIDQVIGFCPGSYVSLIAASRYSVSWPDGSSESTYTVDQSMDTVLIVSDNCITENYSFYTAQLQAINKIENIVLCEQDTLFTSERTITSPGIFYDTLQYIQGCDSLLIEYHVSEGKETDLPILGDTIICLGEESLISIENGSLFSWPSGNKGKEEWLDIGSHSVEIIDSGGCKQNRVINISAFLVQDWLPTKMISKNIGASIELSLQEFSEKIEILEVFPSQNVIIKDGKTLVFNNDQTDTFIIDIAYGEGCISKEKVVVKVIFEEENLLTMSNIITPFGNVENRMMKAYLIDEGIKINSFKIYDRWGSKIYQSIKSENIELWDGKANGTAVTSGVYIWLAEIIYEGKSYHLSGDVSVIL